VAAADTKRLEDERLAQIKKEKLEAVEKAAKLQRQEDEALRV